MFVLQRVVVNKKEHKISHCSTCTMREVFEKSYNFQTLSEKIPISEPTLDGVYIIAIVYVRIVYYLAVINLTCVCSDSDKMKIPLSLQLPWMDIGRRS